MLLRVTPSVVRKHHQQSLRHTRPAEPQWPVLVAAEYTEDAFVLLTFDRDVEFSAEHSQPLQLFVDDGGTGFRYRGGEFLVVGTRQFHVEVSQLEPFAGTGVKLTAGPQTGIVASEGLVPWLGVSGVGLPLGE